MRSSAFAILSLACVGLLSACNNGASFNEEEEVVVIPPGEPASVTLLVSSPQIPSSATSTTAGVQLLATVRDANQNNVAGIPVSFSTSDTGMNITVVSGTTDDNGLAEAVLTVFSNKANRTVTVTATVQTETGPVAQSVNIAVIGTTLAISGPSSGQINTPASYTATLTDAAGAGISGATMTFSGGGTFAPGTSVTTNSSGQATVTFTPTGGSTTVSASALGLTASQAVTISVDLFTITAPTAGQEITVNTPQNFTVTWTRNNVGVSGATVTFAATRGTLSAPTAVTNGSGVATVTINSAQAGLAALSAQGDDGSTIVSASRNVEFVATTPATIVLQPDPTTISVGNTSTLRAVVRDSASNFVKNQTVNFTIDQGPGSLSAASAVTNSQGTAVVTYTATATSAANGVIISAEVGTTGITDTESITVGGNALRIGLGTGNTIEEPTQTLYRVPFSVVVSDSNGSAVSDKRVTLSVYALNYYKGTSQFFSPPGSWARTDGAGGPPIECQNEDGLSPDPNLQYDGILNDPAFEDVNGNDQLEPSNFGSVPNSVTTDSTGVATFYLTYLQEWAYWVEVRLRATVAVDGSESVEETEFLLPGAASDFNTAGIAPPGINSPGGTVQNCAISD